MLGFFFTMQDRLFQLAEDVGMKKPDSDRVVREVTKEDLDNGEFPESGMVGVLTIADVHRCILHAMEALHFEKDVRYLPGKMPQLKAFRNINYEFYVLLNCSSRRLKNIVGR